MSVRAHPSDQALVASDGAQLHGLHPPGFDPSRGAFAFGDEEWPGIAKLVEECGEVIQVVGKLMMTHGSPAHWSGDLRVQLLDEVADVEAAVVFFMRHNPTDEERRAMVRRITAKVARFEAWHADMDADPPPAIATEARRAETENTGSVHEGAGRQASPNLSTSGADNGRS